VSALQFADKIRAAGLTPPNIIEPEKLYRFPGADKRSGNTAGWCKLFANGLGGVYGDFSQDLSASWQATRSTPLSAAQRAAFNRQIAESKATAHAERQAKQSDAAMKAAAIWHHARPANDDHPYLLRKGIKAHGAKLHKGALVIPLRDGTALYSLQFIREDGTKRFLTDGRIKGCYFSIGSTKDKAAICIAEGFATGATIHEATGHPVAVAFNAGNLEAVAMAMRAKETTWT
jgi:putative DNA primase/helicase